MRAFIGLGANLGDRSANIDAAVQALGRHGVEVKRVSSMYETTPVGVTDQPDFLNGACEIETDLEPIVLVRLLKQIESEVGRGPTEKWGPRQIDLDLLLYGDETIDEDGVRVPHPELTKRAFAMVPILELDPQVELPSGEPLSAFCEKDPPGVRRV